MTEKAAEYLSQYYWERDPILLRLEEEAKEENIPIVHQDSIQLISLLVRMKGARSILEIGTAIGYSAIWLAKSQPSARVLCLEINTRMVERARANIAEAGLTDRVRVLFHDAKQGLPPGYQDWKFDFIFMDATKAEYETYLEKFLPHLEPGGVLVTDNTLFQGNVFARPEENPRLARIGEQLHRFNQRLFHHPQLLTTLLPVGDGIAISIKM